MLRLTFVPAVLPALLMAAPVAAQTCLGLPSFASGFVHVNAVSQRADSASAYAIGIGAGRPNELFGNIGGGQATYEGFDQKSTSGFLELGYQMPVGRAQFCPTGGLYIGSGPDDDLAGFKVTTRGLVVGGAVGTVLALPRSARFVTLVPNAALRYEYLAQHVEEELVGSATSHFHTGVLDVGLGFVFFERLGVQPLLHIPFGGVDNDKVFALFGSVSVGWRDR